MTSDFVKTFIRLYMERLEMAFIMYFLRATKNYKKTIVFNAALTINCAKISSLKVLINYN